MAGLSRPSTIFFAKQDVDARRKAGHHEKKNKRPGAIPAFVIPGRAKREPGIHNHDREYGFRACAKRRIPE
jgi:hypothetical protein